MSEWYDRELQNKNYLSPIGFRLIIQKTPKVSFLCQDVGIPEINLGTVEAKYQGFVPLPLEGNLSYGDFSIEFLVDENMENYLELHDWMRGLGVPVRYNDRYDYLESSFKVQKKPDFVNRDEQYSDATLIILNNNYNTNFEVVLRDMFPVSLSAIPFNVTDNDNNFLTARASFRYTYFDIFKTYNKNGDPTRGG